MDTIQILDGSLLHYLEVLVLSGIKFILAPALSMGLGFSYLQTIIVTSIGGLAGFYFFYYLSELLIKLYYKNIHQHTPFKNKPVKQSLISKQLLPEQRIKKSFTFLNKAIVRLKVSLGITGIALITPVLLSIPLGAFLINKYYSKNNKKFLYLTISIFIWSFVVSSLMFVLRNPLTQVFH